MVNFHFDQSIFLVYVITGVVFVLAGWYVRRNPPSNINRTYGYRTPRSMRSKEAWDFAQTYSAKHMVWAGLLLCILGVIGGLIPPKDHISYVIIPLVVLMAILLYPIILTEIKLRKIDN